MKDRVDHEYRDRPCLSFLLYIAQPTGYRKNSITEVTEVSKLVVGLEPPPAVPEPIAQPTGYRKKLDNGCYRGFKAGSRTRTGYRKTSITDVTEVSKLVVGLEPTTCALRMRCSTN